MAAATGGLDDLLRRLLPRGRPRVDEPRGGNDRLAGLGCNLLLARARACENHVYVVSSTYMDVTDDWMISAVFDREGDFRSMVPRHRPVAVPE